MNEEQACFKSNEIIYVIANHKFTDSEINKLSDSYEIDNQDLRDLLGDIINIINNN